MVQFFQNKAIPFMSKVSRLKHLLVLRDSFMLAFPATIFGSFAVVLMNLPFAPEGFTKIVTDIFGNANNATMAIMTIFVSLGIGFYLAKANGYHDDAHFVGITTLVAFFLVTPTSRVLESGEKINGLFNISNLGASGMFVGMIIAFIAAELHCFVIKKGWKISMPEMVPETVAKSFSALIPMLFSLTIITLLNYFITKVSGDNLHVLIFKWLQAPLLGIGGTFGALMVTQFLIQLFWFFGIHGHNVVNPITTPIFATLGLQNLEAYTHGQPRVNIITQQFQDIFTVGLGGSGMTLIVVLMMIFIMKSKTLKSLGKLAIGPGMFNVNEPVTFGLPVVLNPLAFVPWIFGTMLCAAIAYFAMDFGLVPLTTGVAIPWTTPIFISGIMATNSIAGGILQLVQAAVIGIIWFPFLKAIDKQYLKNDTEEE